MAEHTVLELCTGGGGQVIGLEQAGFTPAGLIEIDGDACATLLANRPDWPVRQGDITRPPARWLVKGTDLVAGGLPCTPHTRGGRQLGEADDRHLWDAALKIISWVRPRAVMLETADAILSPRFGLERASTLARLRNLGYRYSWEVADASDYGVPQRRRRAILAAFRDPGEFRRFTWPQRTRPPTVGETLLPLVRTNRWTGAPFWAMRARDVAPTVVGGSRKHGGPDLGASQGKAAWRKLGIDPLGIADAAPGPDGKYPRGAGIIRDANETGLMLTVEMAAALQGFPPGWTFCGGKTSRYRQVGNALPPPVAAAVGRSIAAALDA